MDVDKLVDEIDAAAETQTVVSDDDVVIQEMATPLRPSIAASSVISHDQEEKQEALGDNNNNNNNNDDIMADLIPEADFASEIPKPADNTNNEQQTSEDVAPAAYDPPDIAIPEATQPTQGGDDDNNNNNNNNDDDDNIARPDANDTVVTGGIGDTEDNNNGDTGNDDVGAAYSGNANLALQSSVDSSPRNKDVALAMGSAFDDDLQDPMMGNDAFIDQQRDDRGHSIYNVEPVAMDVAGQDTHGTIPNLIVELRFDLKLCFQGIEIDDKIAGPLIALRPIVETRLGQDVMELVSGVVNEDQKVLNRLTEYNEADTKFYNAAKWGSVGMLLLFCIFGVYALIHLLVLADEANIAILIGILAFVIIIAFCLLAYMLRRRQQSKESEQEWRETVLKQLSSEMKNLWAIAANVDDDPDPAANELNIAFSLYYPLKSTSHDKENEIGNSEHMCAMRISNGPIIALDKGIEKQSMYDTTADGL